MDYKRKFKFKLASHLGMTVGELEQRMTNKEFNEWLEYSKDEPLMADRLEMMLAQLASIQSGRPSFEHLVSLNDETKTALKQQKLEQDMKNAFKGK